MADGASKAFPTREPAAEIVVDSTAHRLIPALAVAALIVFAPLPFGSAHGWSLWMLQAGSLIAAASMLCFEGFGASRRLRPLLVPVLALFAILLLQLLPLPLSTLRWLSPTAAELCRQMVDSPGRWFAASVNPHASLLSIVRLLGFGAVFFVVATAPLPGRRSLFYWSILLSGALAGASSWSHVLQGWDTRLFGEFDAYQAVTATPRLHWPLLNPNHLATAMNVTCIVALGAFLCPSMLGARAVASESQAHRTIALLVALLTLSVSIGTSSKGGLASGASGIAMLALLWPSGRGRSRVLVLGARIVAGLVVLAGAAWLVERTIVGADSSIVLAALARRDATLQVRLEVVRQGLRMLQDFLWLGSGFGTWGDAFPRYQRYPLVFATVNHAHCDVLEWLTDVGVVGSAATVVLGGTFVRELRRVGDEEARKRIAVLAAAFGSLLVHSMGDFALRVPSIAIVSAALLGLAWRESTQIGSDRFAGSQPTRALGALDAATVAACCGALVYLGSWEWRDERLLARLSAKEPVTVPESADSKVFEALARRQTASGKPALHSALHAVWKAPLNARGHHALAYEYQSDVMRERELRRTVACEPSTRFWRLEHAISLAALGNFTLARKEIEEGFYFDPQYGDVGWLRFEDPIDRTFPFLEAAIRGVRRRVARSPELAYELAHFESLQRTLYDVQERRQHGR